MSDSTIENISRNILKRLASGKEPTEEQVYALWEGTIRVIKGEDTFQYSGEAARLADQMNEKWVYQIDMGSGTADFTAGSIWGSMNMLKLYSQKQQEDIQCKALSQKYSDKTSYLFLNVLYTRPGVKNNILAQVCSVTPSRISQITRNAMEDGLITFQKSGREKYYYLKDRGKIVYKTISEEKQPKYPQVDVKSPYKHIVYSNETKDFVRNLGNLFEKLNADRFEVQIGITAISEYRADIIMGGNRAICSKTNYLSNNYESSWNLQVGTNTIKQPLYID